MKILELRRNRMNSFKRFGLVILLVSMANVQMAMAQESVDAKIVAKIRAEGF